MAKTSMILSLLFLTPIGNQASHHPIGKSSEPDENTQVYQHTMYLRPTRNQGIQLLNDSDSNVIVTSDEGKDFRVPSGLTFSRKIKKIPNDVYLFEELNGSHCKTTDSYGSNECAFKWGESMGGQVKFEQDISIDENQYIQGVFKLKKVVDWTFSCAACGKPCVLSVPVINKDFSFPVPDCPFVPKKGSSMITKTFNFNLPKDSPSEGVKLPLEGSVFLKNKVDDSVLAEIYIDVVVK